MLQFIVAATCCSDICLQMSDFTPYYAVLLMLNMRLIFSPQSGQEYKLRHLIILQVVVWYSSDGYIRFQVTMTMSRSARVSEVRN